MTKIQKFDCHHEPACLFQRSWDWLITGRIEAVEGNTNLQNTFVPDQRLHTRRLEFYSIRQKDNRVIKTNYNLLWPDSSEPVSVRWSDINTAIQKKIHLNCEGILVDSTTLSLECLLYLFRSLIDLKPKHLFFTYTSPEQYPEVDDSLPVTESATIEQPKGFIVFQTARRSKQIILPGFDKGRVYKYIINYDWPLDQINVIIGDPPYAKNGIAKVKAANDSWLPDLENKYNENIIKVPAHDPFAMRDMLDRLFRKNPAMDIIPLGPTPLILGVLLFYFGLSEAKRKTIRFLCDFPNRRRWTTEGLKNCYLYDLDELIT